MAVPCVFPQVISAGKAAYMKVRRRTFPGPSGQDRRKSIMNEHLRSPHTMRREVSGDGGHLSHTLASLWPYIWPSDRPDLRRRVLWSLVLLVAAKLATLAVPFAFKFATDGLAHEQDATGNSWIAWVIAAPLLMTSRSCAR